MSDHWLWPALKKRKQGETYNMYDQTYNEKTPRKQDEVVERVFQDESTGLFKLIYNTGRVMYSTSEKGGLLMDINDLDKSAQHGFLFKYLRKGITPEQLQSFLEKERNNG